LGSEKDRRQTRAGGENNSSHQIRLPSNFTIQRNLKHRNSLKVFSDLEHACSPFHLVYSDSAAAWSSGSVFVLCKEWLSPLAVFSFFILEK
jgi:hypothetical protein